MIFCFVAINCKATVVLLTSSAEHCENYGGFLVSTLHFVVNCHKYYYMEVNWRQRICAEVFDKKLGTNVLPPIHFQMVRPVVSKFILLVA